MNVLQMKNKNGRLSNMSNEIVEIGMHQPVQIEFMNESRVTCPKCRQLYDLSLEHHFYCLRCDPNRDLLQMILSLKIQLNNETQSRMYSGSAKHYEDFTQNIVEPKIEEMAAEIGQLKTIIEIQQNNLAIMIKKVKAFELKLAKK